MNRASVNCAIAALCPSSKVRATVMGATSEAGNTIAYA